MQPAPLALFLIIMLLIQACTLGGPGRVFEFQTDPPTDDEEMAVIYDRFAGVFEIFEQSRDWIDQYEVYGSERNGKPLLFKLPPGNYRILAGYTHSHCKPAHMNARVSLEAGHYYGVRGQRCRRSTTPSNIYLTDDTTGKIVYGEKW